MTATDAVKALALLALIGLVWMLASQVTGKIGARVKAHV